MEPQLRNFCMFIKNWTFCTSACSPSVQLLVATESAIREGGPEPGDVRQSAPGRRQGACNRPYCAAAGRKQNCLYWVQRDLRCPDDIPGWWHARQEARIREGVVIADVCFPGERPAASGHLLRSRHHPRRRASPTATPGHVATSTGTWPGGSCSCRPRSCQRRQRHAGLA